jgi:hypothetical protein
MNSVPFSGLGGVECHGSVRGSVRSSGSGASRKEDFLHPPEEIAVRRSDLQLYLLEGERIKRLKRRSYLGRCVPPAKHQGPREYDRVSSARSHVVGHGAFL